MNKKFRTVVKGQKFSVVTGQEQVNDEALISFKDIGDNVKKPNLNASALSEPQAINNKVDRNT